jgi:MHS family proline/betaine transporter-like MFS transporter
VTTFSKKQQRSVILAVTFGNILEWYEIYLYIYWAPIIAGLFFTFESPLINLTNTLLLFAMGFLVRPLGGVFFGRLGDRVGRKRAFYLSIIVMTVPTFLMGCIPTYAQIGVFAPILLALMRILQSFPSGGELPGAFCYLYESAGPTNRRFMTSWGAVGNQLGIIISMLECFFLKKYLSHEALITWGWRISFLVGGLIGLCGFYLRRKLHETPLFEEMARNNKVTRRPILEVVKEYRYGIWMGILICALDAAAFYALSVFFPVYFEKVIGTSYSQNIIIALILLIVTTVPLPFFGLLGDKFNNKTMLITSTVGIILLLYPLYHSIHSPSLIYTGIIGTVFTLCFTCLTALIPFLLADLFPTRVRYTCVGLSFNIVDGVVGGLSPVIGLYLVHYTGNPGSFCWVLLICALISLYAYLKLKRKTSIPQT